MEIPSPSASARGMHFALSWLRWSIRRVVWLPRHSCSDPHTSSFVRRCVNTFLSPLSDSEGKDEYAAQGYLDADKRAELLAEWGTKQTIAAQLKIAKGELEKLRKAREETASSPRDQRYMPSNMPEAILFATQDEQEAAAVRLASLTRPRLRTTPLRGSSLSIGSMGSSSSSRSAFTTLTSAIRKSSSGSSCSCSSATPTA